MYIYICVYIYMYITIIFLLQNPLLDSKGATHLSFCLHLFFTESPGSSSCAQRLAHRLGFSESFLGKFRSQTSDNIYGHMPTLWTDGTAEAGRVREGESRRKKIREEEDSKERRCRCAKR